MKKKKTMKQQEYEDMMEELKLLYWVLSDEKRTEALCKDIENVGDFYVKMVRALSGKDQEDAAK